MVALVKSDIFVQTKLPFSFLHVTKLLEIVIVLFRLFKDENFVKLTKLSLKDLISQSSCSQLIS